MCQTAIALITKALNDVSNAEILLDIKGVIALFIQTMEVRRPPPSRLLLPVNTTQGLGLSDFYVEQLPAYPLLQICGAAAATFQ